MAESDRGSVTVYVYEANGKWWFRVEGRSGNHGPFDTEEGAHKAARTFLPSARIYAPSSA